MEIAEETWILMGASSGKILANKIFLGGDSS